MESKYKLSKKKIRLKPTGKEYICIGKKEDYSKNWEQFFDLKHKYPEVKNDLNDLNHTTKDTLLLMSRGVPFYVDASEFKLAVTTN